MRKKIQILFCLIILGVWLTTGCSKSDDQRDFEKEALVTPDGITETQANGDVVDTDPDDWRISPMYRSLISLGVEDTQPPYPNPVKFNSNFTIEIFLNVTDAVNAIDIRTFRFPNDDQYRQLDFRQQNEITSFNTITIPAENIALGQGSSSTNIYRILIYDGDLNLITYGDVRVQ